MADLKISALPASTTPLAGTEILPIVQSATTRQVSVANLTAGRAVSALSLTSTNDATINGVTVGRGGGSVSLNTAVGASALAATSTGDSNAAFGASALASNLAGIGNTATGFTSLRDNTSGNYNVASGYLALGTNLSGSNNVGIGFSVLSTATAISNNTAIGHEALKVASGGTNTAIGYQSGIAMTTGTKNVILGSYSGNTGTLDIRISNNNIVLSDGDGNVRAWWDNANARFYGTLLATGITNSALTSGRVTYAGTSGVLQDNANFVFDGNNVGIGISATANSPLAVQANTGNTAIRLVGTSFSGTSNAGIYWYDSNNSTFNGYIGNFSTSFDFYNQRDTPIIFSANGAEKLRITGSSNYIYTASGVNVGIGTSSPSNKLSVVSSSNTVIRAETTGTDRVDITLAKTSGSAREYALSVAGSTNGYGIPDQSFSIIDTSVGQPRLTINTSGNVGIGVTAPACILDISGASGGQIKFPATQNASSNANTLDDYEEGTWTPTQGTFDTWTSPVFSATYTKIGRLVTVFLSQQSGTVGWSASDYMGGLPFTVGTSLQAIGYAGDTTPVSDNGYILADSNSTLLFFNKANASEAALCFTISYQV